MEKKRANLKGKWCRMDAVGGGRKETMTAWRISSKSREEELAVKWPLKTVTAVDRPVAAIGHQMAEKVIFGHRTAGCKSVSMCSEHGSNVISSIWSQITGTTMDSEVDAR
jgi:hypothetical protein